MTDLAVEVEAILADESVAAALQPLAGSMTQDSGSQGALLSLPILVAALSRLEVGDPRWSEIITTMAATEAGHARDAAAMIRANHHFGTGHRLVEVLFGTERFSLAGHIARQTDLDRKGAVAMMTAAAWILSAAIANRPESKQGSQQLQALFQREERALSARGWDPWLETAIPKPQDHPTEVHAIVPAARTQTVLPSAPMHPEHRNPSPVEKASLGGGYPAPRPSPASTGNSLLGSGNTAKRQADTFERLPPLVLPLLILAGVLIGSAVFLRIFDDGESEAVLGQTEEDVIVATTTSVPNPVDTSDSSDPPADTPTEPETELAPVEPATDFTVPMIDPTGTSNATGVAQVMLVEATNEVCYDIAVSNMGAPYEGHIHIGNFGEAGGIVVDFGQLTNESSPACLAIGPAEFQSILASPTGHYVEMHHRPSDTAIRAQLSNAPSGESTGSGLFDPDGNGARLVVGIGTLTLEGPVADQATADRLLAEIEDLRATGTAVINDLTITEGAPLPTGQIALSDAILFNVDSSDLNGDDLGVIQDLAQLFRSRTDWRITVVGHADAAGDAVLNLSLSLNRASAVREALVDLGVPAERLAVEGPGSANPIADNSSDDGRASNRRTEFRIDRQ